MEYFQRVIAKDVNEFVSYIKKGYMNIGLAKSYLDSHLKTFTTNGYRYSKYVFDKFATYNFKYSFENEMEARDYIASEIRTLLVNEVKVNKNLYCVAAYYLLFKPYFFYWRECFIKNISSNYYQFDSVELKNELLLYSLAIDMPKVNPGLGYYLAATMLKYDTPKGYVFKTRNTYFYQVLMDQYGLKGNGKFTSLCPDFYRYMESNLVKIAFYEKSIENHLPLAYNDIWIYLLKAFHSSNAYTFKSVENSNKVVKELIDCVDYLKKNNATYLKDRIDFFDQNVRNNYIEYASRNNGISRLKTSDNSVINYQPWL